MMKLVLRFLFLAVPIFPVKSWEGIIKEEQCYILHCLKLTNDKQFM